jgi:hypothetical protein
VQGSILGPVLYAIFLSPLFRVSGLKLFAVDSFITKSSESLTNLITDTEKTLEAITKWLKQSVMKVNQNKTGSMSLLQTGRSTAKSSSMKFESTIKEIYKHGGHL